MTKIELGGLVALLVAVATAAVYITALQGQMSDLETVTRTLDRRLMKVVEEYAPMPSHTIVAWTDTSGQIPPGWVLCGQDNTVNLDGRFLMGTSNWSEIGEPAGTETHQHSVAITSGWEHAGKYMPSPPEVADNNAGGNWNHKHQVQGSTHESGHIPPAVKVFFLCKQAVP